MQLLIASVRFLLHDIASLMTFPTVDDLLALGIASRSDASSASIGKRYSRFGSCIERESVFNHPTHIYADEIGTPFGVTIDPETLTTQTVTIRERDSMAQIRVPLADCCRIIQQLATSATSWEHIRQQYPAFEASSE